MSRRAFLGAAAATGVGLLAADAFVFEPNRVSITRHAVGPQPTAPGERLTVVQISDLHLRAVGRHEERIARAVRAERPDVVAITGDAIDRGDALPLLQAFLELLGPGLSGFAILGNWEHWAGVDLGALERLYERYGVELLVNRSATLGRGGRELLVTGLDDLIGGRPSLKVALHGTPPSRPQLVLAHCPAHRDLLGGEAAAGRLLGGAGAVAESAAWTAHFQPLAILSGHTHGGQLRLGPWAPLRPAGSGRYVNGWYAGAPGPLYVSRGLGTSVVPARFGSPPELAVFEVGLGAAVV